MQQIKLFEEFNAPYSTGKAVWQHIVAITPNAEDLPTGFKKLIIKHRFKLATLPLQLLLQQDPDFEEYYRSKQQRYDQEERPSLELFEPIVVVNGEVLDGYSRAANLLRQKATHVQAYINI